MVSVPTSTSTARLSGSLGCGGGGEGEEVRPAPRTSLRDTNFPFIFSFVIDHSLKFLPTDVSGFMEVIRGS